MAEQVEKSLVAKGSWGEVRYARRADGKMPASEFIESLDVSQKAKLFALFERIASHGVMYNREKFKIVEGDIFEFKSHQVRVSCYRDGAIWWLLHGFIKKQDDWPKGELKTARLLLAECQSQKGEVKNGNNDLRPVHGRPKR